ncbi:KEOPS complex kinase/ATPase Bud32 [Thermoproteota archaeon]
MEKIAQGAEAILYKDKQNVLKDRFEKKYRHPEIDRSLRKSRTRREAKVIDKLQQINFPVPKLINMDDKEMKIEMEHIPGPKLRDVFEENPKVYSRIIGEMVAKLHNNNIIHQDLTTSNMILNEKNKMIYFIDFGLSFFSEKEEDKAVDLHLLRHALESKHYKVWKEAFDEVVKAYKANCRDADIILKRLEKVEKRGRNKSKH